LLVSTVITIFVKKRDDVVYYIVAKAY